MVTQCIDSPLISRLMFIVQIVETSAGIQFSILFLKPNLKRNLKSLHLSEFFLLKSLT